jgi:hypothetical protein
MTTIDQMIDWVASADRAKERERKRKKEQRGPVEPRPPGYLTKAELRVRGWLCRTIPLVLGEPDRAAGGRRYQNGRTLSLRPLIRAALATFRFRVLPNDRRASAIVDFAKISRPVEVRTLPWQRC